MSDHLQKQLDRLRDDRSNALLAGLQRGIEKESLRIDPRGVLAQTPHPASLGSALTHPRITTDFSEALMELITPVHSSAAGALEELNEIHRQVYAGLPEGEQLWCASMPCLLEENGEIPVAEYGSSNVATMKRIYRLGLGLRYGRRMQTIAGIHYNFSIPEPLWQHLMELEGYSGDPQAFITDRYFALIRNFRRYSWLLLYLFGASPALCECFLGGAPHRLETLSKGTLYLPYATTLRMGDLGYKSSAQSNLRVCYNSLDNYIRTLKGAITEPHPEYQAAGIKNGGEYQQLSDGLLQIENEFYSSIRPKRVTRSGEIPLGALRRGGVEYIEVRCLDVNPFAPLGIEQSQIHFLDSFLLFCLLQESPACNAEEHAEIQANQSLVVNEGRRPGLMLQQQGQAISLQDWGHQLLEQIQRVAARLDSATGCNAHLDALQQQQAKLDDPSLTPSARLLNELQERQISYAELVRTLSSEHQQQLLAQPISDASRAQYQQWRDASLTDQRAIEAADQEPFDDYLSHFYQQYQAL